MKIALLLIITPLIILLAAGCSGETAAGGIERVTSIPADQLTESALVVTPMPTTALIGSPIQPDIAPTTAAVVISPTPLDNQLAEGSAMQIAAATDAATHPTPRSPLTFDQSPVPIAFDEFYDGYNMRTGLLLSDKLLSLDGDAVTIEGYMAPPLKPELDYFVLTRIRLAFCPFCSTAADWPDDIALIYLTNDRTTATLDPVRITGRMEVGSSVDQETGMVSLVRIYADNLEIIR